MGGDNGNTQEKTSDPRVSFVAIVGRVVAMHASCRLSFPFPC